ncbi:MAG: phosphate ABC transporter permease PstA [Nitrospirales bacterium]|nr:phosphate ABC transporter permease PstA [Nitrospirales bacterium]
MRSQHNHIQELLGPLLMWGVAAMVTLPFLWITGDLIVHGVSHLSFEFLLSPPHDAGRQGGIRPILVSTFLIIGVCITVAMPIGVGTALYLSEYTRNDKVLGRLIRSSLDILAGVPSSVFGLFGNVLFCQVLGLGFSILSGGLTLACMMLPIMIRTIEEGFRSLVQDQRLSAAALGLSKYTTIRVVLLPAAIPSIVVAGILGLGRALAETAALVFTSGYVDRMPESLLDSGRSLSVHIYDLSMNVAGGNAHAYATALVLLSVLLSMNVLASRMVTRWTLHIHTLA